MTQKHKRHRLVNFGEKPFCSGCDLKLHFMELFVDFDLNLTSWSTFDMVVVLRHMKKTGDSSLPGGSMYIKSEDSLKITVAYSH